MNKRLLGGFFVVFANLLNGSDDSEKLQKQNCLIVKQEYCECLKRIKILSDNTDEIIKCSMNLPNDQGSAYLCRNAQNFKEYINLRLKSIAFFNKVCVKAFGESDQQGVKNLRNKSLNFLEQLSNSVEEYQKKVHYCDKCAGCNFSHYNKDDMLIEGYRHLENIPQIDGVINNQINGAVNKRTHAQLLGQLSNVEKHYINLVHYKHHQLQEDGLYQCMKNLKPISFDYNDGNIIKSIKISDWNLLHVFMGDIKGKHLAGVHNEDKDLFNHFYERDDSNLKNLSIRANNKYQKISTFFPNDWNMEKCLKIAHQALGNIDHITPGDQHGPGNLVVHGKTDDGKKIAIVVDPAKNLAISFYPE